MKKSLIGYCILLAFAFAHPPNANAQVPNNCLSVRVRQATTWTGKEIDPIYPNLLTSQFQNQEVVLHVVRNMTFAIKGILIKKVRKDQELTFFWRNVLTDCVARKAVIAQIRKDFPEHRVFWSE